MVRLKPQPKLLLPVENPVAEVVVVAEEVVVETKEVLHRFKDFSRAQLTGITAFHDRDAGRAANKSNEDYVRETDRPYRGRGGDRGGRGRGGRGRTFHDGRDDRRSHGRPKFV